jgi:steroid delta-isomerase-like uncharacterized protein
MSDDLTAPAHEQVEAFNASDWDRLRAAFTPDGVYEEPSTQRRLQGADAIVEANQGWRAAFSDAKGTITDEFACGDRVAVQVTWEGTHDGTLHLPGGGEIAPTNRPFSVRGCEAMRIQDGKIVEAIHYFDMLGLLDQLGAVSADSLAHAG